MGDCRIKEMNAIITRVWGKVKRPLFFIIWTLGVIGWVTFYFLFPPMYQESQKVWESHLQRTHIQDSTEIDGEKVEAPKVEEKAVSLVIPEEETEARVKTASRPLGVEELIQNKFQDEKEIALAIAKAESGLNPNAQGFNCRYNGISQACRKGDEHKAWSTDCGLYQINIPGTTCPQHLFNPAENIKAAYAKYEARKWQPWSAWKSGAYLAFL